MHTLFRLLMSFLLLDTLNCVYIIYIHIYIYYYMYFLKSLLFLCLFYSHLLSSRIFSLFLWYFSSITFPIFNLLLLSFFFFTLFFVSSNSFPRNSHTCFPFLVIFRSVTPFSSKFHFSPFIILQTFKSFSLLLLTNYFTHFHSPFSFLFWFPPVPISFDFSSPVPDFYLLPFFSSRSSAAPFSSVLFPAIPFFLSPVAVLFTP